MSTGVGFDWDEDNTRHLKRHHVTSREFEEVMMNDPLFLEYQSETGEERYRVLGITRAGKALVAVWTPRGSKVRAIAAYRASRVLQKIYKEATGQE